MRAQRWLVLTSCSVAMLFASSAVRASGGGNIEGGTITFVGAVVEPTCSAVVTPSEMNQVFNAAQTHRPIERNCLEPTTAGVVTDAYRPYDIEVVHLSNAEPDHVLRYFAGYVRAAQPGSADPVLMTQTYD
ncbi:hypothetical protein [Dyella sp. 2HG41-7]|uniref:hypothetical protein n=1 Tax=Dyella sp. 2HG41-7 TaxID=2883239 RepID=UPI001F46C629|nr:hypothetical protein [Dyella sp. 2HG41-7]